LRNGIGDARRKNRGAWQRRPGKRLDFRRKPMGHYLPV
jgi:hypothetical protein